MNDPVNVTPRPLKVDSRPGKFDFRRAQLRVDVGTGCDAAAETLRTAIGLDPASFESAHADSGVIRLGLKKQPKGQEGYELSVSEREVSINASSTMGLINGVQTFRQLMPPRAEMALIPCVYIEDAPRFPWRGFMLDESRRFFGREHVENILDAMALFKLNVFHWHLTDDQGWRIESKRYPRLTEVGAWRNSEKLSFTGNPDGKRYGGFYTQDDIREIVAYAMARGITVVPEIDMPGHSLAVMAAYPELSCTGGPFDMPDRMSVFADVYCAGKEETFTFIENLLDELLVLFPSAYVHTGADEVLKTRWRKCPHCQERIHTEGLSDENGLQAYFSNRVGRILAERGKKMIGWHEMFQHGLEQGHLIQYWNLPVNKKKINAILADGREMINSAYTHLYLSHGYEFTSLKRAYEFSAIMPAAEPYAKQVVGLEATLFSEHVMSRAELDVKLFPRLVAFAESGWSREKDYDDFMRRLPVVYEHLNSLGIKPVSCEALNPPAWKQFFSIFYRHG